MESVPQVSAIGEAPAVIRDERDLLPADKVRELTEEPVGARDDRLCPTGHGAQPKASGKKERSHEFAVGSHAHHVIGSG